VLHCAFVLYRHEKVTAELKSVRDQLLLCGNKDLDVQKTRSSLEHVIRDMNAAVAQSNQENKVLVDQLNKDVSSVIFSPRFLQVFWIKLILAHQCCLSSMPCNRYKSLDCIGKLWIYIMLSILFVCYRAAVE